MAERGRGGTEQARSVWEGQKIRCSERIEKESSRKETVKLRVRRETAGKQRDRVLQENQDDISFQ